jgi:putative component of membrane protein insertase Oxa1/YidC/SpoIIIJ protein YidD
MKYLILLTIRLYWSLIPASSRRSCIFAESCSVHVNNITASKGFFSGINAFLTRYKQCRSGYTITYSPELNQTVMILIDGTVIPEDMIAKKLLI